MSPNGRVRFRVYGGDHGCGGCSVRGCRTVSGRPAILVSGADLTQGAKSLGRNAAQIPTALWHDLCPFAFSDRRYGFGIVGEAAPVEAAGIDNDGVVFWTVTSLSMAKAGVTLTLPIAYLQGLLADRPGTGANRRTRARPRPAIQLPDQRPWRHLHLPDHAARQ